MAIKQKTFTSFCNVLKTILAVVAGESILVFLITIVQENIFGGISYTLSPLHHILLGGLGTFFSAFLTGLTAYYLVDKKHVVPQIILSILIIAETIWLILYSNSVDPLWFDLMASSSLLVGVWLGVLVFRIDFEKWLNVAK